jgi:hypothetical protein
MFNACILDVDLVARMDGTVRALTSITAVEASDNVSFSNDAISYPSKTQISPSCGVFTRFLA